MLYYISNEQGQNFCNPSTNNIIMFINEEDVKDFIVDNDLENEAIVKKDLFATEQSKGVQIVTYNRTN